ELLRDGLTDVDLEEALHVRHALEIQDALDELVRVLHLVDRLLLDALGETEVAPVPAHLRVQEVLVHRRELPGEDLVEQLEDLLVALHDRRPADGWIVVRPSPARAPRRVSAPRRRRPRPDTRADTRGSGDGTRHIRRPHRSDARSASASSR